MKNVFFHHNRLNSARRFGTGRKITDKINLLSEQLRTGYKIKFGQRVELYSPEFFNTLINQGRIKYLSKTEKRLIATEIKRLRNEAGTIKVEKIKKVA